MKGIWLSLIIMLFSITFCLAQCSLDSIYIIKDQENDLADTTNITFIVQNALNNDLADEDQGVCGVSIRFRHPFVKELFIQLISPSGQIVTLVGGDITATNTQFITWDVLFVPTGSIAVPDIGFNDIWENNQNWLNFNNYNGQYYPHLGNLEDFAVGPVNGNWTLRCIDNADFGEGRILDARLIFCDDSGVTCSQCALDPGIIIEPPVTACLNDPNLLLNPEPVYLDLEIDTTTYNYAFTVFKDSVFYDFTKIVDLRTESFGTYLICPTQILNNNIDILPDSGQVFSPSSLNNYFFISGHCAKVSDSCLVVSIVNQLDTIIINESICNGDSIFFKNDTLLASGTYYYNVPGITCDTVFEYNLAILETAYNISATNDTIDCMHPTTIIKIEDFITNFDSLQFEWFSSDGIIAGSNIDSRITAVKSGTYQVQIKAFSNNLVCSSIASYTISQGPIASKLSTQTDTITCTKDSVIIAITSDKPLNNILWTSFSSDPFINLGSSLQVWHSGTYGVTVIDADLCQTSDSIFVAIDTNYISPIINYQDISCDNDTIEIEVVLEQTSHYTFQWDGVPINDQNNQNQIITREGVYTVTITNALNGCARDYSIPIQNHSDTIIITDFNVDQLTCTIQQVIPEYSVVGDVRNYSWQGPINSNEPFPQLGEPGSYLFLITNNTNGCISSYSFDIEENITLPTIIFSADSLSCSNDSIQIFVNSSIPIQSASWSGPLYSNSNIQPFVFVEGFYTINALDINGCQSTSSVYINALDDKPQVNFNANSISCTVDTVQINTTTDITNLIFQWNGSIPMPNNVHNPIVSEPGIYLVTITNSMTGCSAIQIVNVGDVRTIPTIDIEFEELTCSKDSIQVIINNLDVASVEYIGDSFYSTDFSPYIHQAGEYIIKVVDTLGCTNSDTFSIINNDKIPVINLDIQQINCIQDTAYISVSADIPLNEIVWLGGGLMFESGSFNQTTTIGNYSIQVTGENGCTKDTSFTIIQDTILPIFSIETLGRLSCMSNEMALFINSSFDYLNVNWFPSLESSDTITINNGGMYFAEITGKNGCVSLDSILISTGDLSSQISSSAGTINCRDQETIIELQIENSQAIVTWDNLNNPASIPFNFRTFGVNKAGNYKYNVVDSDGCVYSDSVIVMIDTIPPVILNLVIDSLNCNKDSAQVLIEVDHPAGVKYFWKDTNNRTIQGDSIFFGYSAGAYNIRIVGENFCTKDSTFIILTDASKPDIVIVGDTLNCDNSKVNLSVNSDVNIVQYNWLGDGFVSTLPSPVVILPGVYSVQVVGENGCIANDTITIFQDLQNPQIIIQDSLFLPCDSSSILISIPQLSQIETIRWFIPNETVVTSDSIETNIPGQYSLEVIGKNGCISTKNFQVIKFNKIPVFDAQNDTITCDKDMGILKALSNESNIHFEWITPLLDTLYGDSIAVSLPGQYMLIGLNSLSCFDTATVVLLVDTLLPHIDINQLRLLQCDIMTTELVALVDENRTYEFEWNTSNGIIESSINDQSIDIKGAGDYLVKVKDVSNGCINLSNKLVIVSPQSFSSISVESSSGSCSQPSSGYISILQLNGSPPYDIYVNNEFIGGNLNLTNLEEGVYNIQVIDSFGCSVDTTLMLEKVLPPQIDLEKIITIRLGDEIILTPIIIGTINPNASFIWEARNEILCENCTELTVSPITNTVYNLTYTDGDNCIVKATVTVQVNRNFENQIPNIINVNSNSGNNIFYIPAIVGIENVISIDIFDRWAENVYHGENLLPGDVSQGWDGSFNGKPVNTGVYVLIVKLQLIDGTTYIYKGDITVIK